MWTVPYLLQTYINNLTKNKIYFCGRITPNCKRMPGNFSIRTLKMERCDIRITKSGDTPVMVWKDKLDVRRWVHKFPA